MQCLDLLGREETFGALLCNPRVSVSAFLAGSCQDPGQGPEESRCVAVQLFPGLWQLSSLLVTSQGLRLHWPGFVFIYWGWGGLSEELSGLGDTLT